ncbi:MAG: metal-dependent hydrolase [Alphaproteobacteria bacterium]|nr:metal-dependent hydrolase [Alphaproteobacteria bacterium]
MTLLLCMVIGALTAFAIRRKLGLHPLGLWPVLAGALGAAMPHIQDLFFVFGSAFNLKYQFAITWSFFTLPILAFLPAYGVFRFAKNTENWCTYYPYAVSAAFVVTLFSIFTGAGVQPLWPLPVHMSFNVLFALDYILLLIALIFLLACFLFNSYARDAARLGFIICAAYICVVLTFKHQAHSFAEDYAEAFKLDVVDITTLAQPINPLNWRIIVETKDNRLHDTMINLYREGQIETSDISTRSARINALFMPKHLAIWRIYRRFGMTDSKFPHAAFKYFEGRNFDWYSRFAVFKKMVKWQGMPCAEFRDLRFEGARSNALGGFMICQNGKTFELYQADRAGAFSKLDMMY